MYIRKVMTGFVAATIVVVSISMFGVMWKVNRCVRNLESGFPNSSKQWIGKEYVCEIIVKDGNFEKFVFFRKPKIYHNELNHVTVGRVPDRILE